MKRALLAAFAVLCLGAAGAAAQEPVVDKVEPPNWWVGHSINPVRLLIHGRNLDGATIACPRLTCAVVRVNTAGTFVFADVTVPPKTAPGEFTLTLRNAAGSVPIQFTVKAPLPQAGRFQGFGPQDVIYLIMPDRFANGDTTNDDPAASPGLYDRKKPKYYHGGDLEGVRQKLPYLKDLGVTAIWLNPLYDNDNRLNEKQKDQGRPVTDYHGYGAVDFYGMEEHFGDFAELRKLVDEAHEHGIKVILDMVANHTGPDHPWLVDPPTSTWFNGTVTQHLSNNWQVWTLTDPHATAAVRKPTLQGWFGGVLPDLNQNDARVARYIIQNTLWWVAMSGADGIRQDTWPYVPRSFWRDWMAAIKREYPRLKVVGEVFDGDPAVTSFFQGGRKQFDGIDDGVDAVFDFPLAFPIRRAFGEGTPLRDVVQMLAHDRLYPDPGVLVTFLGNHDVSRFSSQRGETPAGLELAFTFLLTARGTPVIYYGDEIGMPGGDDPDNRRDFPGGWPGDPRDAFQESGRTPVEQEIWAHVQSLLRLRAERPELRGSTPMQNLFVSEQAYVFRRGTSVIALNNDTSAVEVTVPLPTLGPDKLGVCPEPRREDAGMVVTIPARKGCVF